MIIKVSLRDISLRVLLVVYKANVKLYSFWIIISREVGENKNCEASVS